jgi:hypothetical protein
VKNAFEARRRFPYQRRHKCTTQTAQRQTQAEAKEETLRRSGVVSQTETTERPTNARASPPQKKKKKKKGAARNKQNKLKVLLF